MSTFDLRIGHGHQMGNNMDKAMAKFIQWVMREGPWDGCDLDGAAVQDKAEELGLLVMTKYDPKIHGDNEWDIKPGETWFVLAPEILALTSGNGK